jgi:hypothetical protein
MDTVVGPVPYRPNEVLGGKKITGQLQGREPKFKRESAGQGPQARSKVSHIVLLLVPLQPAGMLAPFVEDDRSVAREPKRGNAGCERCGDSELT